MPFSDIFSKLNRRNSKMVPDPTSKTAASVTRPSTTLLPPPAYTETPTDKDRTVGASDIQVPQFDIQAHISTPQSSTIDDPYAFLSTFDTVFLVDDSSSLIGPSWRETAAALSAITPICASHDADGIDLHFLNAPGSSKYLHLKSSRDIIRIFQSVRPRGATPTGARLRHLLKPYLSRCESKGCDLVKPLNIIVITDGQPSDDVESQVVEAAATLEKLKAPSWQVGIQFFQVGDDPGAAEALRELDDELVQMGCPRDIVDTVPWTNDLSADHLLKIVLGSVNRRLDRRQIPTGRRY